MQSSRPWPAAQPCTAQMKSLSGRLSSLTTSTQVWSPASSDSERCAASVRSGEARSQPPENPRPAPEKMTTRTVSSAQARRMASRNSFSSAGEKAFSFSGRLSLMPITPASSGS